MIFELNDSDSEKSERTFPVKAGFEITSPKVQLSKVQDCQFPDDQTSLLKLWIYKFQHEMYPFI